MFVSNPTVDDVLVKLCRIGLTFWMSLIVYSLVSALFGICIFRRMYVGVLRRMYRLLGFQIKSSVQSSDKLETNDRGTRSELPRNRSFGTFKHEFKLDDACNFILDGIGVVVDDNVTKSFTTEEVEEWNFLTRTQMRVNMGLKVELLLLLSIVFRFGMFFIIRLPIGITSLVWLVGTMCVFSVLNMFFPESLMKKKAERYCSTVCCRMLAQAFSAVITIHKPENRANCGSVCVANHTTPIDIVMLAQDNCFTLVGQRHGGFTGMIQSACSLAQRHIWFERKIAEDRQMVAKRLKEHIVDPTNNPILIFPEGTCINNTGVFMFKKGCFELGATIHPVVIKYRREFADPFWNSQEQNMLTYIFMLMTSWAIVCEVYYLEPTTMKENETAIEFAQRVKADICRHGGLVDLPWDGMIKRPGNESYLRKMIEEERKAYCEILEINGGTGSQTDSETDSQSDED